MSFPPALPESGHASQRTYFWEAVIYLLQKQSRHAVSITRTCGQPAVIAEMTFVESACKKALLPGDERVWIERGRAVFDQLAIYEIADFDGSNRPLRDTGHRANVNSLLFAPIIVNEDRAAVAIDLTRPIAHAHTYRNALPVARI